MSLDVRWLSVFLDTPVGMVDEAVAFWTAATESELEEPVGDRDEFWPLRSRDSEPCVWLQRTDDGPLACHPDLYVADPDAAADVAVGLGATITRRQDGLVVLDSPNGLPFCLVRHRGQARRPSQTSLGSLLDQVCLDIPPSTYEPEVTFWQQLTGWERHDAGRFERLRRPGHLPFGFLLQRLDDEEPRPRVHLDFSCRDREELTARHQAWGADVVRRTDGWTVMRDPVGRVYCITGRQPGAV